MGVETLTERSRKASSVCLYMVLIVKMDLVFSITLCKIMPRDIVDVWMKRYNLECRESGVLSKAFVYPGGRSWGVIHP